METTTTILLVDDEGTFSSVRDGLKSQGDNYTVEHAKDAAECLKYVGKKRPDLILLSITLPDTDGFALRQKLKATNAKDVPVIYLTAGYDISMTKKIGILTADDFIAKPVSIPELMLRTQKTRIYSCYGRRKGRL